MGKTPDARLDALAFAVARGASVRAASMAIGIDSKTGWGWSQRPVFKGRVDHFREKIIDAVIGKLTALQSKVVRRLGKLVDSPDDDTALKAIREAREFYSALVVDAQSLARIVALESAVEARNNKQMLNGTRGH